MLIPEDRKREPFGREVAADFSRAESVGQRTSEWKNVCSACPPIHALMLNYPHATSAA
jgi:hypothetical protein